MLTSRQYAPHLIDSLKKSGSKLGKDCSTRPLVKKMFNKSVISKIQVAAQVSLHDQDAHLEGNVTMLASVLFGLEELYVDTLSQTGGWQAGEPAEHGAIRALLAQVGPVESLRIYNDIMSDPVTYAPIPEDQRARLSEYFEIS